MKCNGIHVASGEQIEISFQDLIQHVDPLLAPTPSDVYISPGWIDLQVNGFAGVDYNSPQASVEQIGHSIREMFRTGVTRFFPTVITGSPEDMAAALRNLARAKEQLPEGAAMEAFHIEGPYISPEEGPRGAHPARWVRPPDVDEFRRLQDAAHGHIRLITLSPEWPQSPQFIETVVRQGVVASIGHTKASAEQITAAVDAGATLSTHLGNAAHPVLPRGNYIWDQLAEDRLAASFIVDSFHLSRSFLNVALRAKGLERAILVTDAVMPAGCPPGPYRLGEVDVVLNADGSVRLSGGSRLAGSALQMDRAIENVIRAAGLNLREAVSLTSRNPARVGRISSRQRGLVPGERADLTRFQFDETTQTVRVVETYLDGLRVFPG
ncbi:MAG TPA: amidohydrolase family protein [Bryobacteraceae bacterium]|nr:amidohydrolase family protein [Bryobacteraceae bacterium]